MEKNIKILKLSRLNNSVWGNPRYEVIFSDGVDVFTAKTMSDGSVGYYIENFAKGEILKAAYHTTRSGNIIIEKLTIGGVKC